LKVLSMQLIHKYFPDITSLQQDRFERLYDLYADWNDKINVISRKDMDYFYERHVLHSLAIAKVVSFAAGTRILDVGTGGGFPGIPLAILFPESQFTLVDSIGKKIKVVNAVIEALNLDNCSALNTRAEMLTESYDFIVSRAVTELPKFMTWVNKRVASSSHNTIANGILYLKGGDISEEIKPFNNKSKLYPLKNFFDEPFFDTKLLVHLSV
jgi:16S rRNA (guanine527-N7)-methyltransferase